MEKDSEITFHKAYDKALTANPELYTQLEKESN